MILGKELIPHYIFHLIMVTVTNQLPQEYKSMSGLFHSCKIYFSTYDHYFGEIPWGKIAGILKRKWPK